MFHDEFTITTKSSGVDSKICYPEKQEADCYPQSATLGSQKIPPSNHHA